MTSRERLQATLNHREPDRLAVDFGATYVTGIAAGMIARMREALFGDEGGYSVKVIEPYQMLGEIDDKLAEALGIDTVMLSGRTTMFGIELTDFKPFTMFDGTEVLVPGKFNTTAEPNGDILQYPEGDKSAPPSGRMPKGGFYFDAIVRQDPIDEAKLDPADNLEEFAVMSGELLGRLAGWAEEVVRVDKGVGVDTQKTLPFGTAEEVYDEVRSRIDIFGPGGGFVFSAIHNVQANVPIENVLAMFRAVADSQKT